MKKTGLASSSLLINSIIYTAKGSKLVKIIFAKRTSVREANEILLTFLRYIVNYSTLGLTRVLELAESLPIAGLSS